MDNSFDVGGGPKFKDLPSLGRPGVDEIRVPQSGQLAYLRSFTGISLFCMFAVEYYKKNPLVEQSGHMVQLRQVSFFFLPFSASFLFFFVFLLADIPTALDQSLPHRA